MTAKRTAIRSRLMSVALSEMTDKARTRQNTEPATVGGLNLLAIGLLGEMQVRHYHEPRHRAPYSVDRVLRSQNEEHSVSE